MSETSTMHKTKIPKRIAFAVIMISSSRFQKLLKGGRINDPSGSRIVYLLQNAGHYIVSKRIVADDKGLIERTLKEDLERPEVDDVITSGGTGISSTDVTIETVEILFERKLPGFGELFRRISYEEIGSASMLSGAVAGLIKGKPVFCLPGSPQAIETALQSLIIPEIGHIIKHSREKGYTA
jgi:molybdenum cofactor biosynthesis protein B